MFNPEIVAIVVFLLAYILFVVFPERRTLVAISGAVLLVILQTVTPKEAFWAINWNVMGIFVGTLVIADIFMESRVPAYLAEKIVNRSPSTLWSILWICIMTSFISAFVENVATVLIMSPIAFALARKLKINPTVILISIAICSNLQGTATLIGDPPSMLLGGFAKMNFLDFFFYKGKPSIFFAVQAGALVSFIVLYFVFRKHREKVIIVAVEKVRSWVPTIILVSLIFSLAGSSLMDTGFSYLAGIICVVFGAVALLWEKLVNQRSILHGLKKLDWETTFFLLGIFIIVGSITATGWIEKVSVSLSGIIGTNIFAGYTLLVLVSMVLSAFIDNVPFLVAMLPVAVSISQ